MSEIKVKQVEVFNIEINNEYFGDFKVESEWEGFKKIVNDKKQIVIIRHTLGNDMLGACGIGDYNIVTAPPDIWAAVKKET